MRPAPSDPLQVLIAGAGVAGLEAMMAVRALAGSRAEITVVAPTAEFVHRPLSISEPFGMNRERSYPLGRIASDFDVTFVQDEFAWVAVRDQRVFLRGGDELDYDALVMAIGARAYPAWPHVPTMSGQRGVMSVRALLREVELGEVGSLALVLPTGATWAFPLYELALLMSSRAKDAGVDVELSLFTPELEPLEVFGRDASAEVSDLLAAGGVRFQGGSSVEVTPEKGLVMAGVDVPLQFDRVLAAPRLEGPAPRGLPCDDDGFIPIDPHGLVHRVEHVYAAGDGTNFPGKQGVIATQQADAVAEVIAKRAGARVDPRPLRPLLRGFLLAKGSSRLAGVGLPGDQIAGGTYLGPYLAAIDARAESPVTDADDRPVPITTRVEEIPFSN